MKGYAGNGLKWPEASGLETTFGVMKEEIILLACLCWSLCVPCAPLSQYSDLKCVFCLFFRRTDLPNSS